MAEAQELARDAERRIRQEEEALKEAGTAASGSVYIIDENYASDEDDDTRIPVQYKKHESKLFTKAVDPKDKIEENEPFFSKANIGVISLMVILVLSLIFNIYFGV